MTAAWMSDPTPTPWGPPETRNGLSNLDAFLTGAGMVVVRGAASELPAVAGHAVRRARALGRAALAIDGAHFDEPWREAAVAVGAAVDVDPVLVAQAIHHELDDGVLVVHEVSPTAWGDAVAVELARVLARGPGAVVVVSPGEHAGLSRVELEASATDDDRRAFYDALVETSREVATRGASLASVDDWWTGRAEGAAWRALSPEARRLLDRIALARRSCSRSFVEAVGTVVALDELMRAELVSLTEGRVHPAEPVEAVTDRETASRIAMALLAHEDDEWGMMRAAELFVVAGDGARARAAAHAALRGSDDHLLRADLWERFDACLGASIDEGDLVRYGELALERGDVAHAQRMVEHGEAAVQGSFPLALLAGRTALARGDVRRAQSALERAASLAPDDEARAVAAVELAELALVSGERDASCGHAERAIALTEDRATRLAAQNVVGKVHLAAGEWECAIEQFLADEEQAVAAGRALDALRARLNRSIATMSLGRRIEARALLEEVRLEGEQLGDRRATCFALANLSVLATLDHDYAEGIRLVEAAIVQMRPLGDTLRLARQIINLALLRLEVGMLEEAEQALAFGRRACGRHLGDALVGNLCIVEARVHLAKGNTLRAATAAEQAIAAAGRSSDGAKRGEAHRCAARVALADGDLARAVASLEAAATCPPGAHAAPEEAVLRASIARASGEPFADLAAQACALAREDGSLALELEAHELEACAALVEGDRVRADAHLRGAESVRDRLATALPSPLRDRFLDRPASRRLEELRRRLDCAVDEPSPPTQPSRKRLTGKRELVGDSAAMGALRRAIAKVGRSDATVLVQGESGTGKELVADALHWASERRGGPLVKINCAALVETLLLSELFGHEKGAFTGAASRKRGRFEQADGGTLFLDEIGDISPKTQVALLRVLQERSFERVGGTSPLEVDVRVVCATHRDLRAMVAQGTFREDLYYRLAGVTLEVPALRARAGDIPAIAEALLARIAAERGGSPHVLSDEAAEALARHPWPGNVRELDNALRAATLFSDSSNLTRRDFVDNVPGLSGLAESPRSVVRVADPEAAVYAEVKDGYSLPKMKKALERACIERALEETGGNITQAAKILGMKRPRVSQLVNQYAREKEGSR